MPGKIEKSLFMLKKLRKDLFRDRVIYELAPDVHGKELHEYYFVMDEARLRAGYSQNFHFDERGIPMIPTYIDVEERKLIYYPISIGQFGLAVFHTWLRSGSDADRDRFLAIADWFMANRREDDRLGTHWLSDVPKPEYRIDGPWPSAFAQSRAISVLLRAFQMTGEPGYRDAAVGALAIFEVPAPEGGVTTFSRYGPIYEEYPAPFITAVLDGSYFSLFGLFDAVRAMPELEGARRLFDAGADALKAALPDYDLGFWIRYNLCAEPWYPQPDPATIMYFRMILTQMELLSRMSGDPFFAELADRWRRYDRPVNILRMYWLKYRALKGLNRL